MVVRKEGKTRQKREKKGGKTALEKDGKTERRETETN